MRAIRPYETIADRSASDRRRPEAEVPVCPQTDLHRIAARCGFGEERRKAESATAVDPNPP